MPHHSYSKAFLCGLILLLTGLSKGRIQTVDVHVRLEASRALWRHAKVSFPCQNIYIDEDKPCVSKYGLTQTLVFIPFDMMSAVLEKLVGNDPKNQERVRAIPIVFLYAPLIALLWCLLSLSFLRELGYRERDSYLVVFGVTTGTVLFYYFAQSMQEEALLSLIFIAAQRSLIRWTKTNDKKQALLFGLFMGSTILTRPTAIFAFPISAALIWDLRKRILGHSHKEALTAAFQGAMGPILLLVGYQLVRYGNFTTHGYESETHNNSLMGSLSLIDSLQMLFGLGKGLFTLSPILLLAVWGAWKTRNRWPATGFTTIGVLLVSVGWHSMLVIIPPDGSVSWGTRYQVHMIAFLLLPLASALSQIREQAFGRIAIGFLFLVGLGIQTLGLLAPEDYEYVQLWSEKGTIQHFIGDPRQGQLPRRVANAVDWYRKTPISSPQLKYFAENYVPDIWGPVYAKRFQGLKAKAIYVVWFIWTLSGVILTCVSFFQIQKGIPLLDRKEKDVLQNASVVVNSDVRDSRPTAVNE